MTFVTLHYKLHKLRKQTRAWLYTGSSDAAVLDNIREGLRIDDVAPRVVMRLFDVCRGVI